MSIISIAVCDRNAAEADVLRKYLSDLIPNSDVCLFGSTDCLLESMFDGHNPYKAIFLRMEPSGMDGIEAARVIRKNDLYVPLIILCGVEKYYKEAFEVFAWQYLLTPVGLKDVERAINPLKCLWKNTKERVLYYRFRSQICTLPHSRILYISSDLHTVNFHLEDGSCAHCRGKLADFEEQLKESTFVRCHQSFFVNMEAVTSIEKDTFAVKGELVPISRSYIRDVQTKYSLYLQKRGKI